MNTEMMMTMDDGEKVDPRTGEVLPPPPDVTVVADQLVAAAREQGIELTGPNGLLTGLTRDGTFYIENGQIKYPIKNFRFNESPVIMLNNVEELGKPVRVKGDEADTPIIVPPRGSVHTSSAQRSPRCWTHSPVSHSGSSSAHALPDSESDSSKAIATVGIPAFIIATLCPDP